MLNLSPIFGAFISTIIMLIYTLIEQKGLSFQDLGIMVFIFPFAWFIYSIFIFILFIPVKVLLNKKEIRSYSRNRWTLFGMNIIFFTIGLLIGLLAYLKNEDKTLVFFLMSSIGSGLTFTTSFYISLIEQNDKKIKDGNRE